MVISRTALGILLACSAVLSGCAPLVIGGAAVTTAVVATDRRTSGAQLEDQTIEIKAASAFREHLNEGHHININSYNRQVLLTGEVPTGQDRTNAERLVRQIDNVRNVYSDLAIGPGSSLSQRSNDVLISSRVRSRVFGTENLPANSLKITTERGVVYLQGLATQREAALATEVARTTSGVNKVVRVFEYISESELAQSQADKEARVPVEPVGSTGHEGQR